MSEPLNTRTLKHFLDFKSDDTGLIEIDEPIGFDAANFVIEQRSDGYGRDISFAGGETEFTFSSQENRFGHQFNKLIEYANIYGFEADVDYILREGAVDYIVGQVDFQTKNTDELRFFSCAMIQSAEQAILERRSDVKVDLYGTEDMDGNTIAPISTQNILLKAKPVLQQSVWNTPDDITYDTSNLRSWNHMANLTEYAIKNSLTWIQDLDEAKIKQIEAQSNLSDVEIEIRELSFVSTRFAGGLPERADLFTKLGTDSATAVETLIQTFPDGIADNVSIDITIPSIRNGESLWIYFRQETGSGEITATGGVTTIRAKSTFIDSVVEGVRFIDAVDKVREAIDNQFVLDAPRFQDGGEWYNNFVFSGNMLRGRNTFELDFDMIKNHLPEFHADYETDFQNLFIGKYDDFYSNTEIGAFLINPNAEFDISFNERHTINTFNFNYKEFDQDKDNENTIDAVHTETQWLLPNKQVENTKDIECEFVRDPYLLENTRIKALEETNASVSEDDEVFIVDVVPIQDQSGGFSASLSHQWNSTDNELKLLNDGSFNWALLGFGVGDDFFVLPLNPPSVSPNQGNYTVTAIERTLITLQEVASSNQDPTTGEDIVTNVAYPFTNVTLTNRTTEGFDSITGLINDDEYSNLLYSPKRNILNNYGSYLSTCTKYKKEDIRNTYYKNWTNDDNPLITQFEGGVVVNEIANIKQEDLSEPILTPRVINTKVLCDFSTYRDYAEKLKSERGFVRVYDNDGRVLRGYIKNSDFLWAENSLTLTLEEKQVNEITTINYINPMFYIDEVGYDQDVVTEIEYKVDNLSYIQFFDRYGRPLTNKLRFEYVSVGGQLFDTVDDLIDAIEDINKEIVVITADSDTTTSDNDEITVDNG